MCWCGARGLPLSPTSPPPPATTTFHGTGATPSSQITSDQEKQGSGKQNFNDPIIANFCKVTFTFWGVRQLLQTTLLVRQLYIQNAWFCASQTLLSYPHYVHHTCCISSLVFWTYNLQSFGLCQKCSGLPCHWILIERFYQHYQWPREPELRERGGAGRNAGLWQQGGRIRKQVGQLPGWPKLHIKARSDLYWLLSFPGRTVHFLLCRWAEIPAVHSV